MAEAWHNLPVQPTPLIGREREVRAARDLLLRDGVRLVTLTGPGGTGKTRVGLQVAADVLGSFPDGVVFVGMAPIADPALVIPTVAQAVGVRDAGSRPVLETLQAYLREQRVLLLLDNFEQILAAAPAVSELLAACPGLKVLVTSRAPLHLRGEHEQPVPPLPLPGPDHQELAESLAVNPAIQLFVERAQEVRPDFGLTEENAAGVAEICRRLDGLPLAIELAAARVKLLSPAALLARLERRLPLLVGGPRDAPERQRTLRDTIAWSHDLLDESEQRLFRRLGVFVGGCTLEAAEAVCEMDGDLGIDVFEGIGSLVDKSLLRQDEGVGGEPRFWMLETVREYALERLAASGEMASTRQRHGAYLLQASERADREIWGPDQAAILRRLEADHDNARAALSWTLGDGNDPPTALRLGAALVHFWTIRGHLGDLVRLEAALDGQPHVPGDVELTRARATALYWLANAIRYRGDQARCVELCEESVSLFRSIDDREGLGAALSNLGFMLRDIPDYPAAHAAAEEGLRLARAVGNWRFLGWALYVLASVMWFSHYRGQARRVPLPRTFDADVARDAAGDAMRAAALLDESLAIYREHGVMRYIAIVLSGGGSIGQWAIAHGDFGRAEAAYGEALALNGQIGVLREAADNLHMLSRVALGQEDLRRATRLLSAAESAFAATRTQRLPLLWGASEVADDVQALRGRLGDEAFAVVWAEGSALSMEEAIAYALRRKDPFGDDLPLADRQQSASVSSARSPFELTPREREVAVLIGQGYSNRRIAERLVIAEKTAEVHARNIREKLGLESRAQIAAWAAQHGLLGASDT